MFKILFILDIYLSRILNNLRVLFTLDF